jgi:hypothetical protein
MQVKRKNKIYEAWRVNMRKPRPDWVQEALDKKKLIFPWDWNNPKNYSMRPTDVMAEGVVNGQAYGFDKLVAYADNILIHKAKKIKVLTKREFLLKGYEIVEEEER